MHEIRRGGVGKKSPKKHKAIYFMLLILEIDKKTKHPIGLSKLVKFMHYAVSFHLWNEQMQTQRKQLASKGGLQLVQGSLHFPSVFEWELLPPAAATTTCQIPVLMRKNIYFVHGL